MTKLAQKEKTTKKTFDREPWFARKGFPELHKVSIVGIESLISSNALSGSISNG